MATFEKNIPTRRDGFPDLAVDVTCLSITSISAADQYADRSIRAKILSDQHLNKSWLGITVQRD